MRVAFFMTITETIQHIYWDGDALCLLDQRLLPAREVMIRCTSAAEVAQAIQTMVVRGAPAIGCSAAYGMVLVAENCATRDTAGLLAELTDAKALLDASRPTAVNLAWATSRMLGVARAHATAGLPALRRALLGEAHAILAEDLAMCHAIGQHGVDLIPTRGHVLTHCNAGGLATAGLGTALAPLRIAHDQGRPIHVFVDETRPYLQGARLTAWELQRAGVPLTLITDNMAGYFMRRGEIDCVIVGADRVVANGDIANKIGTYGVAVLAKAHNIPFYVAAPSSTIDLALPDGDAIPIEQRSSDEVTTIAGQRIAPDGVSAAHPAFDTTPHDLITAIITERGVVHPPYADNLKKILEL
jgi:methylthioribose-1-phosphate isomerase